MCIHNVSARVCFILETAVTLKVPCVLFDGSLGDECWVLCVTWYLHGAAHSLSLWMEGREGRRRKEHCSTISMLNIHLKHFYTFFNIPEANEPHPILKFLNKAS